MRGSPLIQFRLNDINLIKGVAGDFQGTQIQIWVGEGYGWNDGGGGIV